jgi:SAM-dependent methyltransferase
METYKNLCTELYELDKPHAPENELAFYLAHAKQTIGPIFEPMCGTGRFLIPMLEQGLDVDGLDASTYMLSVCKQKCLAKNLHPRLYEQYLHEFSPDKKYGLIFIPTGSFGLITDMEQAKQCLKIIYDSLLPNGKFLFEVETIHTVPKELDTWHHNVKSVHKADKSKIILSTQPKYHTATQILQTLCRYQLIQENKILQTENEDFNLRLYQADEMDQWLKQAGFLHVIRHKTHTPETSEENNEVIIYECIKN